MNKDTILAAIKKHGSQNAAARALGITRGKLQRCLYRGSTPDSTTTPKPASGKSLSDFRNLYDKSTILPKRIAAALKALGPGGWEYEVQFARLAGVSLTDLSTVRDKYDKHVVVLTRDGRRAWAGSAATAQRMREMLT